MQKPILTATGFSPLAADYVEKHLDICDLLSPRPQSTYFLQMGDEGMNGAGIRSNDLVIVDQALNACHNTIIVAIINHSFVVRRLTQFQNQSELYPENPKYSALTASFQIFGVATFAIRILKPGPIFLTRTPQLVKSNDFKEFNIGDILSPQYESTYFLQMDGDAMVGAGIWDADFVLVDRSLQANHNTIIVAIVNRKFVIRRLIYLATTTELHAENPWYPPTRITPQINFQIWGVVTSVVKRLQP